jgi:hypothetical protein
LSLPVAAEGGAPACTRAQAAPSARQSREVPVRQRTATLPDLTSWSGWLQVHGGARAQALHAAYRTGWKTMLGWRPRVGCLSRT